MLAKDNEYLESAANSLFEANADRIVQERCRARREAERRERTLERDIKLLKDENTTLKEKNDKNTPSQITSVRGLLHFTYNSSIALFGHTSMQLPHCKHFL